LVIPLARSAVGKLTLPGSLRRSAAAVRSFASLRRGHYEVDKSLSIPVDCRLARNERDEVTWRPGEPGGRDPRMLKCRAQPPRLDGETFEPTGPCRLPRAGRALPGRGSADRQRWCCCALASCRKPA